MDSITGLTFECFPHGRNGAATVTVKSGSDVLIVDKVDLSQSAKRESFRDGLCEKFPGIDREQADAELLKMAADVAGRRSKTDAADNAQGDATPAADELLAKMPDDIRSEARGLLQSGNLVERIVDDIGSLGVAGERELAATLYLTGVSRML